MNRSLKKLLLRALNPVDYAARVINHKKDYPPLHLRWDVGPLRSFESSAAEFRLYLKLFAGVVPGSRILDIGCGCGQTALAMQAELDDRGRYVGCDISQDAVGWCIKSIGRRDGRFAFFHMDVRNGMYNPRGRKSAAEYRFPDFESSFDIVILKSVFTHMMPDEVRNYVSQLPRLLEERGKCLASFFLLNEHQRVLEQAGRNVIRFVHGEEGVAYARPDVPEAIVAYGEKKIREMAGNLGLRVVEPVHYGTWTGWQSGLSHQDLVVFERDS